MNGKNKFRDYLVFSKKDQVGMLILVLLIGLSFLLPVLFRKPPQFNHVLVYELEQEALAETDRPDSITSSASHTGRLFMFDPNQLDEKGFTALGLSPKQARTIINYRNKGGRFRKVEDFRKIWGLPDGFFEKVKDYIRLPGENRAFPASTAEKPQPAVLDINAADSAALVSLKGIGPKLASRIIHFRERLGGFYSVDQVAETYGLPDSVFQAIRSRLTTGKAIRKIQVNSATLEELKQHPYIRWKLASQLVAYRQQHGNFDSAEGLSRMLALPDTTIKKLLPYLEFN